MIKTVSFHAETPGPRLLVTGGVHGNETCGVEGIKRIIPEIEQGKIELLRGHLTFVPVCNPRAYAQGVRYTERNLNRNLLPQDEPDCYEARLGNILCPILAQCDYLLDIHSYSAGGPPFVFINTAQVDKMDFAASLGADTIISGFAEALAGSTRQSGDPVNWSVGTTEYAQMHGAIVTTLECGQHKDPAGPDIAYQAILRALGFLGMIATQQKPAAKPRHVLMKLVFYRDDDGKFAKPWKHLERVGPGELIATCANGEEFRAPAQGGVIVLPHAETPLGQEWFYLGSEAG
ncbi:MAG: succinylglutamate desuccinylase/aspartoacylase family protein [Alphaproteobacteria bacterium]